MSETPPKKGIKKEWNLNDEAFDKLLDWLDPASETGGAAYEVIRRKLILFFTREKCLWPEDQTDETFNRVTRKLLEGGIDEGIKPITFIIAVARNVLREDYRKPERRGQPIDTLPIDQQRAIHSQRSEDPRNKDKEDEARLLEATRAGCYKKCLKQLPAKERRTLLKYHTGELGEKIELRKKLAAELKISRGALTGRVLRYEKNLLECVQDCLNSDPADGAESVISH